MSAKLKIRSAFIELNTALLVLLFLYTAITKLNDYDRFVGAIRHHSALSPFGTIIAWIVPFLEIAIVLLLVWPAYRRRGLLMGTLLMAIFTCYIAYMLLTQSKLPCTCGGILDQMNWREHFFFNLFITLISLISFFLYPKRIVATKQEEPNTCEYSRQLFN